MEEETLKRNTDCVYFLASPFTCKKGEDCEYRHSDTARLNLRDCWYWLSGNCLNPACAFRHPPLEIQSEAASYVAGSSLNTSLASVTKTAIPCFFYFNGFCNKGDTCPFLHGPEETYSWKPKTVNTIVDVPVPRPETKSSERTNTGVTLAKKHPALSEMPITSNGSLEVQKSILKNTVEPNSSSQTDVSFHEEIDDIERVSLEPEEGSTKSDSEPSFVSDHSSQELVDGNNVRDEWWESSPGFDVLVDGKREDVMYVNDPEYLHDLDVNDEERESHFVQQCYVDHRERGFIEYEPYELVDGVDRDDRKAGHAFSHSHKRKLFSAVDAHDNVDLRDYLRKRRMVEDGYLNTHDFGSVRDERRERLYMHAPNQRLHRLIASKVERNGVEFVKRGASVPAILPRINPRNLQHNGQRHYDGARRRVPFSSEAQRRSFSKRERSPQDYSLSFAGPKSLSEIKGGKRGGCLTKNSSISFEGPKPLSEILKDKKKTTSSQDHNTG